MLLRISPSPRLSLPILPQACLYQQTRGYKNQLFRKPQVFHQTIVLTDGSSFKLMTSSPRKTYRLTRDKFNNPLWTGRRRSSEEDAQNQQLSRFRRAFKKGLGGEEGIQQLVPPAGEDGSMEELPTEDTRVDATDSLFQLMESKDAYVPTRGRDKEAGAPTGKQKGVRT
jgi:hypothetical protein